MLVYGVWEREDAALARLGFCGCEWGAIFSCVGAEWVLKWSEATQEPEREREAFASVLCNSFRLCTKQHKRFSPV